MIRLHHCHQTRSMRVLWLLHELGVDFEVTLHAFDKSLRSADYLMRSPAGRVPALELDGEYLFEGSAILQILCAKFPDNGLGRGEGDADWAEWLVWLNFAETISQHTAALTQQHIALYEDHMRSPVVMKIESARVGKCFDALEAHLSRPDATREYMLASGFSAADIAIAQAVYMARHFQRLEAWPVTLAWYERATDRPAFRASLPPANATLLYQQPFYEVPDV